MLCLVAAQLMERGSKIEEGSLRLLRLVLLGVSITIVAICFAMMLTSTSVVRTGVDSIGVLRTEGRRAASQQAVVQYVTQLQVANASYVSRLNYTEINALLANEIERFTGYHSYLSVANPPTSNAHVRLLWCFPIVFLIC
jgi:hypothetical protein